MVNAMIDVFVSRPTWVAPEFERGLAGFLGLLRSVGLEPRTLGTTDYPAKAPLDEVIRLMDCCAGAVILGYPQVLVTSGTVKGQPVWPDLSLATEWNHIEAALGYARGLPLLLVHHKGVGRGVFDHGAIPNFVYAIDLADPAWPLSDAVRGAVQSWKADVETRKSARRERAAIAHPGLPATPALSQDHLRVLQLLAEAGDEGLTADDVADQLAVKQQKARYYLDALLQEEYISDHMVSGEPTLYFLDARGRSLLAEKGLL